MKKEQKTLSSGPSCERSSVRWREAAKLKLIGLEQLERLGTIGNQAVSPFTLLRP